MDADVVQGLDADAGANRELFHRRDLDGIRIRGNERPWARARSRRCEWTNTVYRAATPVLQHTSKTKTAYRSGSPLLRQSYPSSTNTLIGTGTIRGPEVVDGAHSCGGTAWSDALGYWMRPNPRWQ